MKDIYTNLGGSVLTLSAEDILELHSLLCNNYLLLPQMEPVSPPGLKSLNLLESAISRQHVGSGEFYKYPDMYSNCATLIYGLVKNHAFHNGNKRVGFLSMLKHLYINGKVIKADVKHVEIYELLRSLADKEGSLEDHAKNFHQKFLKSVKFSNRAITDWTTEVEIRYIASWLKDHTEHKSRKIKFKTIAVSELQDVLRSKGLHTAFDGKFLKISKPNSKLEDLLFRKPYRKIYTIKKIKNIPLNIVEDIRRDFNLSILDGVDNNSFYNDENLLSEEIISYKKIIYKLAKT
jgi:death-on-curing family protein